MPEATEYPRTIGKDGKLKVTRKNDWTEGFYPGCLWYVYEYTNKEDWKKAAIKWTESLEPLKMCIRDRISFLMDHVSFICPIVISSVQREVIILQVFIVSVLLPIIFFRVPKSQRLETLM